MDARARKSVTAGRASVSTTADSSSNASTFTSVTLADHRADAATLSRRMFSHRATGQRQVVMELGRLRRHYAPIDRSHANGVTCEPPVQVFLECGHRADDLA